MRIVDQTMGAPRKTRYGPFLAGACQIADESTVMVIDASGGLVSR